MDSFKPKHNNTAPAVEDSASSYVISLQSEPSYKRTRYHWMICGAQKPDELISWGHAPTQEQAETAARAEVNDLSSGLTQGGRVTSSVKPFTHR